MSLCQPDNQTFSCGACCGFLNIELNRKQKVELLQSRTEEFKATVNFNVRYTIPSYRQNREKIEASVPKRDITIYNCPFLGFITKSKIGCMIHPAASSDPLSQNYSFYGTSICQAYTCDNYNNKDSTQWITIFSKMNIDSIEYSILSSDHISLKTIESFFKEKGIPIEEMFSNYKELLLKLLHHRLSLMSSDLEYVTSFEIQMNPEVPGKSMERLVERFRIDKESELYKLLTHSI